MKAVCDLFIRKSMTYKPVNTEKSGKFTRTSSNCIAPKILTKSTCATNKDHPAKSQAHDCVSVSKTSPYLWQLC
jgi:hypothetical protein